MSLLGIQTLASQRVYYLADWTLMVTWLQIVGSYWGQVYFRFNALGFVNRLHKKLFEQLQELSRSYYLISSTGSLTDTLTCGVRHIQQAWITVFIKVTQLSLLLGHSIYILLLSCLLSLVKLLIIKGYGF